MDSKKVEGPLNKRLKERRIKKLKDFFTNPDIINLIENLKTGTSSTWQILGNLQKVSLDFLIQQHPEILEGLTKEEKEELRRVFEDNPPKNVPTFGSALSKLAEKILNLEI
jgi:hypothetical protein